jgi:hypothetical protein
LSTASVISESRVTSPDSVIMRGSSDCAARASGRSTIATAAPLSDQALRGRGAHAFRAAGDDGDFPDE